MEERTEFTPARHAFRFPNRFRNVIWSGRLPPWTGRTKTVTSRGRCGGMVFSALDHFHAGRPVPPSTPHDFAGAEVPPDGHPLADHLHSRQLHSMVTSWCGALNGLRFLLWSLLPTAALTTRTSRELEKIVASIDDGVPVALGLVTASSVRPGHLGRNHQAVCHGSRKSSSGEVDLLIYDPNHPYDPSSPERSDIVLRRADSETSGAEPPSFPYRSSSTAGRTRYWRGFFLERYRFRTPPAPLR